MSSILLLEDDPDTRDSLGDLLQLEGYDVEAFGGGHEALERLSAPHAFSLIILDWRMPQMTGQDFLSLLDTVSGPTSDLPVLVFSADASVRPKAPRSRLEVLTKPAEAQELLDAVARMLRVPVTEA